jgi:hypothetical protein
MKSMKELREEFEQIKSAYEAGKATPEQIKRLPDLREEIKTATEIEAGESFIRKMAGGEHKSQGLTVDGHKAGYLTPASIRESAGVAAKSVAESAGMEVKALTVANYTAPISVAGTYQLGQPGAGFLESIRTVLFPDRYVSYLRQTSRTNNAAPVAEGALKPTSLYGLSRVQEEARVIAHLSDTVDEYLLSDVAAVEATLTQEMMYGLYRAVEDQIINGTGTAPQLRGLLNTSGILLVSTGTNYLTRIRAAITQLQLNGYVPTRIVLNPSDWATIETATATGGEYLFHAERGPIDMAQFRLWGVQVVLSTALAVNTALVLDDNQFYVAAGGPISLKIGQPGDAFQRNQVQFRVEGRFVPVVTQPGAIVKVTLTP